MKRKTLRRTMRIGVGTVAATAALAVLPSEYIYASDFSNLDNNEGDSNLFYHKNSGTNRADIFKNYENGNGLKSTVSTAWRKVKLALAKMKYFYQSQDLNATLILALLNHIVCSLGQLMAQMLSE